MKSNVLKMTRREETEVASNFVPKGKEIKTGRDIANGFVEVSLSKKLPVNLSLAQAWAQNVVINHADILEELGTTSQGFSYAELMWKLRFNGVSPRWGKGTMSMLKRVHKAATPLATIIFE